ncbi:hypothetical protein GTQ43_01295 [Nostoc sp. KVJ3]|uniref:hypothetical protein n=1 Tax=Nostoc sp. KVJ3 TaxID=457945 RepID=UPI002238B2CD|nr:hypothetical protein [Nostoc sp. KVJ3]MCW5312534.1 hypothetical protein [Nostoc sp. KVJ3]
MSVQELGVIIFPLFFLTFWLSVFREQQCWEDTSLKILRERGVHTGLTDYIQEIEQHLTPIILS